MDAVCLELIQEEGKARGRDGRIFTVRCDKECRTLGFACRSSGELLP